MFDKMVFDPSLLIYNHQGNSSEFFMFIFNSFLTVQEIHQNNNISVTKRANTSSKSPELLAKYRDLLLKKSSRNPKEAELEDTLNQNGRNHGFD